MLIEEEPKQIGEVNLDVLESVFEEGALVEEEVIIFREPDEQPDEIDIAFQANDEGYW